MRALQAALDCTKKVMQNTDLGSRPRLVLVSDTPSLVEDVKSNFDRFAEVYFFFPEFVQTRQYMTSKIGTKRKDTKSSWTILYGLCAKLYVIVGCSFQL